MLVLRHVLFTNGQVKDMLFQHYTPSGFFFRRTGLLLFKRTMVSLFTKLSFLTRVFEYTLSYFEDNTLLLNNPYTNIFREEEEPDTAPKGRSLFAK